MKLFNINGLGIGSLDKNTAEGQNGLKALEYAMRHYNDDRRLAFSVIEVEGYKCIAHKVRLDICPDEFDEIIFPFDKDRIYPMQGLELKYNFKLKWQKGERLC